MKTLSVVFLVVVAVMLSSCQPPSSKDNAVKKSSVVKLPSARVDLVLKKYDGAGDISMSDYQGNPLILYFAAPWTDSSKASIEQIKLLKKADFVVIPVIFDSQPVETIHTGIYQEFVELNACRGSKELTERVGGIRAMPTTVFLDSNGTVAGIWPGYVTADEIMRNIAEL